MGNMSSTTSEPYLEDPGNLVRPEEMKLLLEEAEKERIDPDTTLPMDGYSFPPRNGYSLDLLYGVAAQLPFEGLEDKIWSIYESPGVKVEEIDGGSMKTTLHSPEKDLLFQYISTSTVDIFYRQLSQEYAAMQTNQKLQDNPIVTPVTEYELRFTFTDGQPLPVRVGEYRDLVEYEDLPREKQRNLKDEFIETGLEAGRLMRNGEIPSAEAIEDWEQEVSKNRAYDPERDTVVAVDMGELAENQFVEHGEYKHNTPEDFALEDISEAPFSSRIAFLNRHGLLEEIEEYFRATPDEDFPTLVNPESPQEEELFSKRKRETA